MALRDNKYKKIFEPDKGTLLFVTVFDVDTADLAAILGLRVTRVSCRLFGGWETKTSTECIFYPESIRDKIGDVGGYVAGIYVEYTLSRRLPRLDWTFFPRTWIPTTRLSLCFV
jgi:hypothetical protein